jgi:Carboxypeptidase regulatory-like domain
MNSRHLSRAFFGVALLTIIFSLALSAQPDGIAIKGVVKTSSGRLLSSVWVIMSRNGEEKGRSLTGDDGKYYISNLSDGVYDLMVSEGSRQLYRGRVNLPEDSRHDISLR